MTMIRPTVLAAALVLASGAAWAAPADYEDRLPQELNGMALQDAELSDDLLIAYYGQSVGRATLRIIPAPETDASGVAGAEPEKRQPPSAYSSNCSTRTSRPAPTRSMRVSSFRPCGLWASMSTAP
jgi:hypothetical protein